MTSMMKAPCRTSPSPLLPPAAFLCPLTGDIMADPVENAMGVTFERTAILAWLESGKKYCPVTTIAMTSKTLTSNTSLQWKIRYWLRQQQQQQQQKQKQHHAAAAAASDRTEEDSKEAEEKEEERMELDEDVVQLPRPPLSFVCPLTKKLIQDAVMTRSGCNFERAAIFKWLVMFPVCPVTGQPMSVSDVVTNSKLQWEINHWQQEQHQQVGSLEKAPPAVQVEVAATVDKSFTTAQQQQQQQQRTLEDSVDHTTMISDTLSEKPSAVMTTTTTTGKNSSSHRANNPRSIAKLIGYGSIMSGGPPKNSTGEENCFETNTLNILDQVDETLARYEISSSKSASAAAAHSETTRVGIRGSQ